MPTTEKLSLRARELMRNFDIANMTAAEIARVPNLGIKTFREIMAHLGRDAVPWLDVAPPTKVYQKLR